MVNRVLVVASLVVILVVATIFASANFTQSGRMRDQATAQETPTLTTSDVRSGAPASSAPATSAPAPRDVSRAADIGWYRSFNEAKTSAKSNQVIFVDVYTDWCGWCKYMDQRVFTHSDVKAFAANNVFVKVNAEDNGEGTAFARKHGVRGFPALLVFDNQGKLIGRQDGAFRNPTDFVGWLQQTSARR
jgi:thioredoxin 1